MFIPFVFKYHVVQYLLMYVPVFYIIATSPTIFRKPITFDSRPPPNAPMGEVVLIFDFVQHILFSKTKITLCPFSKK